MSNVTPGPWSWEFHPSRDGYCGIVGKDGAEVLFPNSANDGDDGAAWFGDSPSPEDAKLIVTAGTVATECERMAFQGQASIEHLPELLVLIDHPILRDLFGAIEDSGTPEAAKLWVICQQYSDVRQALINKIAIF